MNAPRIAMVRLMMAGLVLTLLSACDTPLDFDLRGRLGGALDTSDAALQASARRPRPDKRGIISYPGYQIAVAKRGDTVQSLAERIGADPAALARHNGLQPADTLRKGEVISLPNRVAELQTGGPDIEALAGTAIDRADDANVATSILPPAAPAPAKAEPIRHKVARGETAYTIARLYRVSVRALAEWNGLDSEFSLREGQYLVIPVPLDNAGSQAATPAPGQGSPTPVPPSAAAPLPAPEPLVSETPEIAPDLGKTQTDTGGGRMAYPVDGKISRAYAKGKNNGIDFSAAPGAPVRAAQSGRVAAITVDADQVTILVLRHDDNMMTVYYNVDNVTVGKDATVSRGQKIASVPSDDAYLHFEVRKGFDSVDPMPFLEK